MPDDPGDITLIARVQIVNEGLDQFRNIVAAQLVDAVPKPAMKLYCQHIT
jgi:hypothetical protein